MLSKERILCDVLVTRDFDVLVMTAVSNVDTSGVRGVF